MSANFSTLSASLLDLLHQSEQPCQLGWRMICSPGPHGERDLAEESRLDPVRVARARGRD
jgi:hypothetical protein